MGMNLLLVMSRGLLLTCGPRIIMSEEIRFSRDLLAGKRRQVMKTAVSYFYHQACEIAEGLEIAEDYRQRANTTIREMK